MPETSTKNAVQEFRLWKKWRELSRHVFTCRGQVNICTQFSSRSRFKGTGQLIQPDLKGQLSSRSRFKGTGQLMQPDLMG